MHPTQSLDAIGWTLGELARRLGKPEATIRTWKHRDSWPQAVVAWLDQVAAAVQSVPAPR